MFNRNKTNNSLPGASSSVNQRVNTGASTSDLLLRELAADYMHDKKVRRRWKIALFVLFAIYLISIMAMTSGSGKPAGYGGPHTALVELNGTIGTEIGTSADQVNESLRSAFQSKNARGVVLRINSPGGTPVQSADINDEIRRLKAEYPDKPIYAVVADMAASGGYYVAVAADKIYANRSSIVGSIGVRMDSFGFVDAMQKYGIERRSLTAGENKAILDPFLPVQAPQKAHAQAMLDQVHQQFIEAVQLGRGERLADNSDLFSGLFWAGDEAKKLGLIDEFGNLDSVARDVIGAETVVNYTRRPTLLDQFSKEFGVAVGTGIANVIGGRLQMN